MPAAQMEHISADLEGGEGISFEDKRSVLDGLIATIYAAE